MSKDNSSLVVRDDFPMLVFFNSCSFPPDEAPMPQLLIPEAAKTNTARVGAAGLGFEKDARA